MKFSLWLCLWCFHDFLSLLASLFSKLNLRQLLWVLFVETFYSCLLSMQRGSVLCLFDIIACKMSLTDYYAASYYFFSLSGSIFDELDSDNFTFMSWLLIHFTFAEHKAEDNFGSCLCFPVKWAEWLLSTITYLARIRVFICLMHRDVHSLTW